MSRHEQKRFLRPAKRSPPVLGLLISRLDRGFHRAAWLAVADAARAHGASLICFDGGVLRYPHGFDAQANVLYDLVDARRVDGLVFWSSTLDWSVEPREMEDWRRCYGSLPVVSVGRPLEGVPSILADNYQGMREAVLHLVRDHGYRHLAFLRGPKGNREEVARYQAYVDVLAEFNLSHDPLLVSPHTNWAWADGYEAMAHLLDERRLRKRTDLDAVVTVSDEMACGAMAALQERGIDVPGDMAVIGFNDDEEGCSTSPALTTVRQPVEELGRRAVQVLLQLLRRETVPEQTIVPLELVVRSTPPDSLQPPQQRPEIYPAGSSDPGGRGNSTASAPLGSGYRPGNSCRVAGADL